MARLQISRTTDPATEPITTAEAKEHLRVDTSTEDDFIDDLIQASREYVEEDCGISLVEQTWVQHFPKFRSTLLLARPPALTLVSLKYLDEDGAEQTVATPTDLYRLDTVSLPSRLLEAVDADFPDILAADDAVRVAFTAGYSTVPESLRAALKLVLAAIYERRGDGEALSLPDSYEWLVRPFRVMYW